MNTPDHRGESTDVQTRPAGPTVATIQAPPRKDTQAPETRAPQPPRQWLALGLSLVVIAAGSFWLHSRQPQAPPTPTAAQPAPVVTVTTAPATSNSLSRTLEVTGSISAWDPLAIGAEVNGLRIEQVLVEEGARVRQGQLLARLNSDILKAQLQQAQGRLSGARATVAQTVTQQAQSRATAAEAEANVQRYEQLAQQGALSAQELLARRTASQTTRAQVDGSAQAVAVSRGTVAEIEGVIAQYQAQIAQTRIVAPDDGWVLKRDARLGEISSTTKSLFTLARDSRMELRALVPEVDLPSVQVGQGVQIVSDANRQMQVRGRVRAVTPEVDAGTRLATVRIDVPSGEELRPGMFVRGYVSLGSREGLTVPASAVLSRDEQTWVFTLVGAQSGSSRKVSQRQVKTGVRAGERVEVVSGLGAGEAVVVAGAGYLKDGDYVRITP